MLEHLSNCHGEWNFILIVIGSIPFIGAWLKFKIESLKEKVSKDEDR